MGVLFFSLVLSVATGSMDILLNGDCDYELTFDNETWFHSADTFFLSDGKKYSCLDGSLKLVKLSHNSGSDEYGAFISHDKAWTIPGAGGVVYATLTRVYDDMIKFSQQFPMGLNKTGSGDQDTVTSAFPSWNIDKVSDLKSGPRGYVTFGGDMCASKTHIGKFDDSSNGLGSGLEYSGPLAVFATNGDTLVTSSASEFMSSSQYFDNSANSLSWGVMGSVLSIPAGFSMDFIIVAAPKAGVNHAMDKWGSKLLTRYGKSRETTRSDFTTNYLAYSTDNGAFYYYYTEDGKTYQDTMLDVADYARKEEIPYRHWLMDSWWYFKGTGGGVKNWTAMPSIFPDGADYVYNQTGWPVVAHNRYWSYNTDYAKQNGGKWDFILEKDSHDGMAFPLEQGFWDELMATGRKWGLKTYEQDWLYNEFTWMKAPLESATLARQWLMQMGTAAQKNGLTVQYCMSWPRHILQSVELPAVTQARASGDYHPGNDQWIVGLSSIFANAVGIKPTKDNFWSTDSECCGKYGKGTRELYNRLQAAVSTLSTGPVAPSDAIAASNVPLIMKSCAKDGLLLQPDRPATRTHASMARAAGTGDGPDGEVWTTESTISNIAFKYIFAANSKTYDMPLSEIFEFSSVPFDSYLALEANSTSDAPVIVDTKTPLKMANTDKFTFLLYALSPVLPNGLVLLGERSKWVPVSTMRFPNMEWSGPVGSGHRHIAAMVHGSSGESVTVSFWDTTTQRLIEVQCDMDGSGTAEARLDVLGTDPSQYKYTSKCDNL